MSLDYFKGVFHTYEILNNPGINTHYGFDIFDFEIKKSIKASFIENFPEFREMKFELKRITKDDLIEK